ncbi:14324_t:CDS:1, partial [Funneliformis caledonium]
EDKITELLQKIIKQNLKINEKLKELLVKQKAIEEWFNQIE